MPPVLARPPAIQKISEKLASAHAAASALVALESLTKRTRPLRPTCSIRCARPANDRSPGAENGGRPRVIWLARRPGRERGGGGEGGFRRIGKPAQRADAADLSRDAGGAAHRLHHLLGFHVEAVGQRPPHRDPHHVL